MLCNLEVLQSGRQAEPDPSLPTLDIFHRLELPLIYTLCLNNQDLLYVYLAKSLP